jgi:hypothetical protein
MATKVCNHCGLEKDEEEFSWRYGYLGVRNKNRFILDRQVKHRKVWLTVDVRL